VKRTISEMEAINPLIDRDGNTFRVSSALTALTCLFEKVDDGIALDGAQTYGLAIILETCAAALRQMGEVKA